MQGRLEHPAIVPVYDVGTTPEGDPFFTMKRVRGRSLAQALRQQREGDARPLTRRKLLTAFSQLCAAVHYAHERGIVHRDIKPSNVMLGAYGEVYLLDWGVAKLMDAGEDGAGTIGASFEESGERDVVTTGQGVIMGSLSTMSPEQAVGGDVGAPADVYALGAILFELLTLEPLHPRGSANEMVGAITRGVEARASVRCPAAEVPPELEALCVAATRPPPQDRVSSALVLHEEIERFLDGDRDLELRRVSSARHADAAERAAARACDAEARAMALREVGRALAQDCANDRAVELLVRILTTPPRTVPPEVQAENEASIRADLRTGAVAGMVVYGAILLVAAPVFWALECRDAASYTVAHVLWGLAFAASVLAGRAPSYTALSAMYAAGMLATAYVSTIFSPFLVVPGLLTAHAAAFAVARPRRVQGYVLALAGAVCLATIVAETTGSAAC